MSQETVSATSLHNVSRRQTVYRQLARRNKIVFGLRWAVPFAGVLLLSFLLVQIVIANIAAEYGISGVTLDKDALVIKTPEYAGTATNGTEYSVKAEQAQALLTNTSVLDLKNVTLDIERPDGFALTAVSELAQYDLEQQTVTVPGQMNVVDSRQTDAVLHRSFINWSEQKLTASGGAHLVFSDGTTLDGDTLVFDGANVEWTFTNARLLTSSQSEEMATQEANTL